MRTETLAISLFLYRLQCLQFVLYSTLTPFDILLVLRLCASPHTLTPVLVAAREELAAVPQTVWLDYMYEETLSSWARHMRGKGEYIRLWGEVDGNIYGRQWSAYMTTLNFTRMLLVADPSSLSLARHIYTQDPVFYRDFSIIPSYFDLNSALQFVGRDIKSLGYNLVAFFVGPLTALHFLQALERKKLNRPGYAYLLSQEAGRFRYMTNITTGLLGNGVLVVAEDYEAGATREASEATKLREIVREMGTYGSNFVLSSPNYSLLYTQNRLLMKAASQSTLFPGLSTTVPTSTQLTIHASVNYQWVNPDLSIYPTCAPMMRGYMLAFEEVNSRTDLIPDYRVVDDSVSFTGVTFAYNFSLIRVQTALKSLGVIYMGPPLTQAILGMSQVYTALNLSMPITAGGIGSILSDPIAYPLFIRSRVANQYLMKVVARMVGFFGWTNIAVLYAMDEYNFQDSYEQFLLSTTDFGITITNPEATRGLPALLNNSTAAQLNSSLAAITQSTTRIILILHAYYFVIMEQLYDLGVREGYVLLLVVGLDDSTFQSPQYYKRRVVSKGALLFFPSVFVGSIGEKVREEVVQRDGSGMVPNTCFFYDGAFLYFYATQYLLEQGLDYEDPYEIVRAMRGSYFYGCSGFFKIQKGSNDRDASAIAMTNFQYNAENDTYVLKVVGTYDPYSTQPYLFTSPIQWPDDNVTYADSKPTYLHCPYLAEVVRDLPQGKLLGVGISFGIAVIVLPVAALLCKQLLISGPELLRRKEPIALEDVLVLGTMVVGCLQFTALGPNISTLSLFFDSLCAVTSVDIGKLIVSLQGEYWVVVDVTLGVVGLWVAVCVLKYTKVDRKLCCSFAYWTQLLMPTLGHLLYLPIIAILSSVFLCYKGVSNSLTDSFLNQDCREFCWRGKHLGYAIGSAVALFLYIPVAMYTRHLWQDFQATVHVKAVPLALVIKSVVQILLIASSNSLRKDNSSVHAGIYFTTMGLYTCFLALFRQYNYDRLNLWQTLLTLALLFLSLFSYIASHFPSVSDLLTYTLLGVCILLGGLGWALQTCCKRFESKLMRAKSRDVRGLFVFAFTAGRRASEGLEHFYSANGLTGRGSYAISESVV